MKHPRFMKSLVTFFVLLFFVTSATPSLAQTSYDPRLLENWESGYLERMASENPLWVARWTFYLDHAWYLTEMPAEKIAPNTPEIVITDLEHVNIFALERQFGTRMQWQTASTYRIKGSDKLLVYQTGQNFTKLWNASNGHTTPVRGGIKILSEGQ